MFGGKKITKERAKKIQCILRQYCSLSNWEKINTDPFETLIKTIISQNTNDLNTERAFENLSEKFGITPKKLSELETSEIEKTLKVAGLYKSKANSIIETAKTIHHKYDDSIEQILSLPLEEARKTLIEFKGIGPKTADVVLLFSAQRPTFPVDTHVNRVAKRLGFAPVDGDYESVRKSLQELFEPSSYLEMHLLLICHGRWTCKARSPDCDICPINEICPTKGQWN